MKKKAFLTGILGIALIFATLVLVGCPTEEEDDNPFKGTTWKAAGSTTATLTFADTTFTLSVTGGDTTNGTYTHSGNTATLTAGSTSFAATISGTTLTVDGETFTGGDRQSMLMD
jgi:hypothetical protein